MDEIYSVKEIAEILKMSTASVRALIKLGRLQALNVSKGQIRPVWKIKRSQLDEFLKKGGKK